jgi:uncharacterized membrane protein YeaQ/YmgE (transglycosylase-associated protein family)
LRQFIFAAIAKAAPQNGNTQRLQIIHQNLHKMIWHIILGGLAGFLAGKVMRGQGYGVIVDILLGLAGGLVGSFIAGLLHIPPFGYFITAFLGALLLVWLTRAISR